MVFHVHVPCYIQCELNLVYLSSSCALSITNEPFGARLNLGILVDHQKWRILGNGQKSKFEPVMGRGESSTILVPGVGGRGVPRGKAVKHYLATNHHPVGSE